MYTIQNIKTIKKIYDILNCRYSCNFSIDDVAFINVTDKMLYFVNHYNKVIDNGRFGIIKSVKEVINEKDTCLEQ